MRNSLQIRTLFLLLMVLIINTGFAQHFSTVWTGNPYQPMSIIIQEATINSVDLSIGDEIAVFDIDDIGNEICVGIVLLTDSITISNPAIITTSSDDPITSEIQEGFITGNTIMIRLWDSNQMHDIDYVIMSFSLLFDDYFQALGTALVTVEGFSIPTNYTVIIDTIGNGQQECFNATDTVIVAGSGNNVDILSGGEAIFIAGEKIIFEPGFNAHPGSYVSAYITTSGEYCGSLPPMAPKPELTYDESDDDIDIFEDGDSEIRIYPNPTTGLTTIDFMGKATKADIQILNFQGNELFKLKCDNKDKVELDISTLPRGMYFVVIKTQTQLITKKIIRVY